MRLAQYSIDDTMTSVQAIPYHDQGWGIRCCRRRGRCHWSMSSSCWCWRWDRSIPHMYKGKKERRKEEKKPNRKKKRKERERERGTEKTSSDSSSSGVLQAVEEVVGTWNLVQCCTSRTTGFDSTTCLPSLPLPLPLLFSPLAVRRPCSPSVSSFSFSFSFSYSFSYSFSFSLLPRYSIPKSLPEVVPTLRPITTWSLSLSTWWESRLSASTSSPISSTRIPLWITDFASLGPTDQTVILLIAVARSEKKEPLWESRWCSPSFSHSNQSSLDVRVIPTEPTYIPSTLPIHFPPVVARSNHQNLRSSVCAKPTRRRGSKATRQQGSKIGYSGQCSRYIRIEPSYQEDHRVLYCPSDLPRRDCSSRHTVGTDSWQHSWPSADSNIKPICWRPFIQSTSGSTSSALLVRIVAIEYSINQDSNHDEFFSPKRIWASRR